MRVNLNGVIGEIDSLPGCTQIGVSHSVFLPKEFRGKGLGIQAGIARCKLAFEELGYDGLLCTVDSANEAQRSVLRHVGWGHLTTFNSRKTGHTVELWFKQAAKNAGLIPNV